MSRPSSKVGTNMKPTPPEPGATMYTMANVAYLLVHSYQFIRAHKDTPMLPKPIKLGREYLWKASKFDKWIEDGCPRGAK